MAINEKATVELQVNGEQAKQELKALEGTAIRLQQEINAAYAAGDIKKMKKLQKELDTTNRQLKMMRTNTVNINEAMKNLSDKSPKDLQNIVN